MPGTEGGYCGKNYISHTHKQKLVKTSGALSSNIPIKPIKGYEKTETDSKVAQSISDLSVFYEVIKVCRASVIYE